MKKRNLLSMVAIIALMGNSTLWAEKTKPHKVKPVPTEITTNGDIGIESFTNSNTWDGSNALFNSQNSDNYNSAFGGYAGYYTDTGSNNTFIGYDAGYENTSGDYNVFVGSETGGYNTDGTENTFVGDYSGYYNETGNQNVFLGNEAGNDNVTGSNNVFLGNYAGHGELGSNKLYIEGESHSASTPLIYGEFDTNLVRVNGTFETSLSEESDANTKNIVALDRNNTGSGGSDVGFSLENIVDDYKWTFRTYAPSEGFSASKIGTGGTEFEVGNTGTDLSTTVVKMGGVVVFKDGHLVNTSGQELASLVQEQGKMLARIEAEAKDKNLKMAKMEATLTAKDAEMIALKAEVQAKGQKMAMMEADAKTMKVKIAQFETIQQKVAMMESILTNLALNTSDTYKEKVSLNLK